MAKYKIAVVAMQSDKNQLWKDLQNQYATYLSKWADLEFQELAPGNIYQRDNVQEIWKQEEVLWQKVLDKKKESDYLVALDLDGKMFDTEQFAKFIQTDSRRHWKFLIGGPYGLPPSVRESCDFRLALSPLTFNHQLAKLILLEQLYRALEAEHTNKYNK
jgi:23S rRNA (pseudouridine1915-N3)-methyltransferase